MSWIELGASKRRAAPAVRRTTRKRGGERAAKEKPFILIVDDVEDNRALYAEYLRHHGMRVEEAVDGQEALEKITALVPDLVIMDLSMPRLDGWEATRLIKANEAWKDIPVLVVTGHAIGSEIRRAREAGCDDLCTKPCLPQQVLEHVRRLLGRRSKQ